MNVLVLLKWTHRDWVVCIKCTAECNKYFSYAYCLISETEKGLNKMSAEKDARFCVANEQLHV